MIALSLSASYRLLLLISFTYVHASRVHLHIPQLFTHSMAIAFACPPSSVLHWYLLCIWFNVCVFINIVIISLLCLLDSPLALVELVTWIFCPICYIWSNFSLFIFCNLLFVTLVVFACIYCLIVSFTLICFFYLVLLLICSFSLWLDFACVCSLLRPISVGIGLWPNMGIHIYCFFLQLFYILSMLYNYVYLSLM